MKKKWCSTVGRFQRQVLFGLLAEMFSVAGTDRKIYVRSSFYQNVVNLAPESDRFDIKALDIASLNACAVFFRRFYAEITSSMNGGKLGTIIFPILTTQQVITVEEKQSCYVVDIQHKDRRSLVILYVLFVIHITGCRGFVVLQCFLGVTLYKCKIKPRT